MPQKIIIGNLISLSAAVFLFAGSISKKARRVYLFGVFECILLFVAQLFFGQGAAAISLLIAAFRNLLLVLRKYTRPWLLLVFFSTLILGVLFNTGGIVGFLPLFATLIFTVTSYKARGFLNVKLSLLLNLLLWCIYSFLILDLSSTVINVTSIVLTLCSIYSHLKTKSANRI